MGPLFAVAEKKLIDEKKKARQTSDSMEEKKEEEEKLPLKYLFLDLNSYFATIEQQDRPDLRGKPVAVVPMETDSTCAIAASYEAKAYGVKTGTKIFDAKRMCPNLICVLARHDRYVEYHHRIVEAAEKILPIHKIWSIDEFDCQLMGREQEPERALELARAMKEQIWQDVGPHVNCSIGIAPNGFLAKVATDLQKPNGLVMLRHEDLPGRLLDLDLLDLPGINVNMLARLRRSGINDIQTLYNLSPKQARQVWGSVQGERFWYWLHGHDMPPPETSPCVIGHSRVLDPALRAPNEARLMSRRLLTKAAYRLRRKGFYANTLTFSAKTVEGAQWVDERRFPLAHDIFTFLHHLDEMWSVLDRARCHNSAGLSGPASGLRFKKVAVTLSGLHNQEHISHDLLVSGDPKQRKQLIRHENLADALDQLQDKYKKETVWMGIVPKTLAGHVGTKIAFSRVPDREEFWN
jgi:DNA polymerase-4